MSNINSFPAKTVVNITSNNMVDATAQTALTNMIGIINNISNSIFSNPSMTDSGLFTFTFSMEHDGNWGDAAIVNSATTSTLTSDNMASGNISISINSSVNNTELVAFSSVPYNVVQPVITGAISVGSTATISTGTWNNSPTTYSYRWYLNNVDIGASTNSLTFVQTDIGKSVKCFVTATNAAGAYTIEVDSLSVVTAGTGSVNFAAVKNSEYVPLFF